MAAPLHPSAEAAPGADARPTPTCAVSADGRRAVAGVTAESPAGAAAALSGLDQVPWRAALVFARDPEILAEAGERLRADRPGLVVAGCTAAGLVDRETRPDAAVQVTLLGGPGLDAAVELAPVEGGGDASRRAGATVALAVDHLGGRAATSGPGGHSVLVLLADGLVGDTNQTVRGAYEVAGATVPIVGGCAGDNLAMSATWQLAGDTLATRSAVGLALRGDAPFGVGVRHGWQPIGAPMTVTAADGTSILALDDRPALDAYLEVLGVSASGWSSADLARFCQTRPLGLESRGGYHVRFIRGADGERRSIEFLVGIGEGELVTLMHGGTDTVVAAAGSAVEDAVSQLAGPPLGIVAFDCVACRGVIGESELFRETEAVGRHLPPGATLGGLYTYGEIARRGGGLGFHNQTMVVLAVQ